MDINTRNKLLYRSKHRGTKEADILVGSFIEKIIDGVSPQEINDLEDFLELKDHDLVEWYMQKKSPKKNISNIFLQKFLEFSTL